MRQDAPQADAGDLPRRLRFLTGGFLDAGLRRVLRLAGHDLAPGLPRAGEGVIVWGRGPYAHRGEWAAARAGVPLIRAEDAFLRSVHPGRARRRAALGLLLDPVGVHYDASRPSRIEVMLAAGPTTDTTLRARAVDGIARLRAADLSKYNSHDPDAALPEPGYVLVIDQTRGDASIRFGGADAARFAMMLAQARADHPDRTIVVKSHPEVARGLRPGHFTPADLQPGEVWLDGPVSPWKLLAGAAAVYAVTSQLGYEAVLAGHRPVIFGQPFYAGWGLTEDRAAPLPRRGITHDAASLFAVTHLTAPIWVSPCLDRCLTFEEAVDQLEAEARAWREDRAGYVALNMRLWKRRFLNGFFGQERPLRFARDAHQALRSGRPVLVWGSAPAPDGAIRVEDGFLRSRGLGAELVPPVSLIADRTGGVYYDPAAPLRIEAAMAEPLPPGGAARARRLAQAIRDAGISKYNLTPGALPDLPPRNGSRLRILVPGQVEDDASIRLGGGAVRRNLDLLRAARAVHPGAFIIFKPHPDVQAGLRPGAVDDTQAAGLADLVVNDADPLALIGAVDRVWTMTSTLGFEALLRGCPVTCLGAPFYAGYGLTDDLGPAPARRQPADLAALIHACLIAAPRYRDPVTGLPCPPEVIVARLASGQVPRGGPGLRLLAKAQGALSGASWLWRGR
ncbi:capsular polysaccharide biosynthesis protein [Paracoccus sp. p4-l81]|uniref:capsular polysaccharide biosynthesis protein n=1 Tax=Paracoccus sp. p4-l81 TaxID=3342806 RepID=UPI0035BB0EAC